MNAGERYAWGAVRLSRGCQLAQGTGPGVCVLFCVYTQTSQAACHNPSADCLKKLSILLWFKSPGA